jgi:hypothetical protein
VLLPGTFGINRNHKFLSRCNCRTYSCLSEKSYGREQRLKLQIKVFSNGTPFILVINEETFGEAGRLRLQSNPRREGRTGIITAILCLLDAVCCVYLTEVNQCKI